MNAIENILLTHARSPVHWGDREHCSVSSSLASVYCGDRVSLFLVIDSNILRELWHTAEGCLVSQASASYLCEWGQGLSLRSLIATADSEFLKPLGPLTPMRQQCALLSLRCLKMGIEKHLTANPT
ncbi:MAG: iron-sulfur cluster assembly scaffold protein [Planctomycetaceae bacterium]|nr:iron-sulfur cluster assembly scaffold protein [Planctomycetaceae bacterium]